MYRSKLDKVIDSQTKEPSLVKTVVKAAIVGTITGAVKLLSKK